MSPGVATEAVAPPLEPGAVLDKAGAENFPVALRLLRPRQRQQLLAIYGYARFVDDVGDLVEGDRAAQLDWVEAELDRALEGSATHPIFVRVGECAAAIGAGRQPFADLLAANRQDQEVTRYATFEDLVAYCALSANPVGRLVLGVFSIGGDRAVELSDQVCTGLQVVEHLQDVGEDLSAGRVYLPLADLERFGSSVDELASASAPPALRRVIAFECGRARTLLISGVALVAMASGAASVALAGFVGGGLAQLDAIEAADFDVLAVHCKASKGQVARRVGGVLRAARRAR